MVVASLLLAYIECDRTLVRLLLIVLSVPLAIFVNVVRVTGTAFLDDIARSFSRPPAALSTGARAALLDYHWPGNVRELRNVLERAAILCESGLIQAEHLALRHMTASPSPLGIDSTNLASLERQTIDRILRECHWNKTKAAQRLGMTRTRLYLFIRKFGLEKSSVA